MGKESLYSRNGQTRHRAGVWAEQQARIRNCYGFRRGTVLKEAGNQPEEVRRDKREQRKAKDE